MTCSDRVKIAFLFRSSDLNTSVVAARVTTKTTIMIVGKAKPALAKLGRLPIFSKLRKTELTNAFTVTSNSFRICLSRLRANFSGLLRIDIAAFWSDVGSSDGGFKRDVATSKDFSRRVWMNYSLPRAAKFFTIFMKLHKLGSSSSSTLKN
jgi:hypothetical protein